MSQFPIDQEKIFAATNGGLDIISEIYPFATDKKHFQLREADKTNSAVLWKSRTSGIYYVKDFGDYGGFFENGKHAIHIFAHVNGIGYYDALKELASRYGVISGEFSSTLESKPFSESFIELNEDGYHIEYKDFDEAELNYLGPLVTKETCERYNLKSVKSYSWIKYATDSKGELDSDKSKAKVFTKISTPFQPLFAIEAKPKEIKTNISGETKKVLIPGFVKILQPGDREHRFRYFGQKNEDYIFGLDYVEELVKKLKNSYVDEEGDAKPFKELNKGLKFSCDEKEQNLYEAQHFNRKQGKLKRLIIASGDRDAMNIASCGEAVIWFNSETQVKSPQVIGMLYKYADEIINIPDIDSTGIDAGKDLALSYLEIKTAWIPEELYNRKNKNLKQLKDFTDFIKFKYNPDDRDYSKILKEIHIFLDLARLGRFWDELKKYDKEGKPIGQTTYKINYKNAFNFLKLNGFSKIKDVNRKDGYYYVHQHKHIITEVSAQEIKDFFNRFLDEKQREQGRRHFPDDLLNMLLSTEAISDKKLVNIENREFDFTDYTPKSQYFFFDSYTLKVTEDNIEKITKGYSRFVKEEDIINNTIKEVAKFNLDSSKITIEKDKFFEIKKDETGNWELEILRKDCDFMNFLINASRVNWKSEIKELKPSEIEEYLKEHNFCLDNYKTEGSRAGLDDDQVYEQELHFINKVYALGYMLHRYKDPSKAWCVYVMDNEVVDDNESHGRTGKSLPWNIGMRLFMNSKYIGARNKKLVESEFIYDGVTEQTDYVLFDDADKRFQFNNLFADITGDLNVNPKTLKSYTIPFSNSPKFCITTNYAPFGLDTSTKARILFVSNSDYYHGESEEFPERTPLHDFNKRFFEEWNNEEYNLYINFMFQCLQFYLKTTEKLGAPQSNIKKRNLLTEMGVVFLEWAEDYFFDERLNKEVPKLEAFEALKAYNASMKNISVTAFKRQIMRFCEYKGYTFNPKELINTKDGRITQSILGKATEMIYLKSENSDVKTNEIPFNTTVNDDEPY